MSNAAILIKAAAISCVTVIGFGQAHAAAPLAVTADALAEIAPKVQPSCDSAGRCHLRVTPDQLLAKAESLIEQKNYQAALPLVDGEIPVDSR